MKRRQEKRKRQSNSDDAAPRLPTATNNMMKRPLLPLWTSLNNDIFATCFSYCDAADLMSLRRSCGVFRQAARLAVSRAQHLHLSVLVASAHYKQCYNDKLVSSLLEDVGPSLQTLELCGLRNLRGGEWINLLLQRCSNLESLDLSGCTNINLDSSMSLGNVPPYSPRLKHLNLTGCHRLQQDLVSSMVRYWRELETLSLAGCSQTINASLLQPMVAGECFSRLTTLDLSGLKRMMNEAECLCLLPASLECLLLAGCERLSFPIFNGIGILIRLLVRDRAQEGHMNQLTQFVRSGNMDEFWSHLDPFLNNPATATVLNQARITFAHSVFTHGWPNLRVLDVSHLGIALGSGFSDGFIALISCLSGGSLREVNISGCDYVSDEDIMVLASTCKSLTCLKARACRIGDDALAALGKESRHLAYLDVSACFDITDTGVRSLCPFSVHYDCTHVGCPALRSLKLASLPHLTDDALMAIGDVHHGEEGDHTLVFGHSDRYGLKKLLLLDVRDCAQLTAYMLETVMTEIVWPSLVELEATGISGTVSRKNLPPSVRFLNGRSLGRSCRSHDGCCTAMVHSQRLNASQGIELQPWFHCLDCKLLPSTNRGMCGICEDVCHKDHNTFFGSMARFYCDCAFGIAGGEGCKALTPTLATIVVSSPLDE